MSQTAKRQYAVFGAGGFGREVIPLLRQQLEKETEDWELVFVDDNAGAPVLNGYRVLTYSEWITAPAKSRHVTIAIANSQIREKILARCIADDVQFVDVVAQNVVMLDEVQIGVGAIICQFVTITSNVRIGKQFHVNYHSYVAHDCVIGDFVTFAPGVRCNGNIVVEDHAYIGSGAIIRQGTPDAPLVIGRGAVVGMGAVVTKSVAPGVTVVGNPARPLVRDRK